jgi:uncharacterized protein
MQYRKMPKIDEELSALGYGCMRFPTVLGGVIDKDQAKEQLLLAIDNGLNYLDTAFPYHLGGSESFLGEHILKDGYREKVYIATKMPSFFVRKSENLQKFFDKQIEKLNLDYIDYYLIHALNGSLWDKMLSFGIIDFMDMLKREKKVRYMGFSFHGSIDDFKRIVDDYDWDFTQVQYNLLDEHFQAGAEGIEYAASKDIGVVIMEPLRGGVLVGQIPKSVQKIWDEAPLKRSPADWALRWIWNNPNVHVVLSGMNKKNHIIENMNTAHSSYANSLTDEELVIVDRVKEEYRRLLQVGCTGCRYCMPCPAGIDIPAAFHSLNSLHLYKRLMSLYEYASVTGLEKDPKWTSACIDCGNCEKACPQNIEVRKEFLKVQRSIERPIVKFLIRYVLRPFWVGTQKITDKFLKEEQNQ